MSEQIIKTEAEKFQELLLAAGLGPKPKKEDMTPEQKVARILELEVLLTEAKKLKDEKTQKRLRREARKLGFYRSKMMKVVIE